MNRHVFLALLILGSTALACGSGYPNNYYYWGSASQVLASLPIPHQTTRVETVYGTPADTYS